MRVGPIAGIVFLGVLPVLALVTLFAVAIIDDSVATDYGQFYWAAQAIVDGDSPYAEGVLPVLPWGGAYPYPPLPALLSIPLTALPFEAAGVLVMGTLVVVALATLLVLGVRDWRCYGVVMLWPPVISAIQTGNVTLWFALALAVVWRFRHLVSPVAASLGTTLAVKFFLWPVVLWLVATRRYAAAAASCAVGAVLIVLSWVPLGFAGFVDYPGLLHELEETIGADSYTLYIVGIDLGLPSTAARALWLVVGLGLLGVAAMLGWRGEERTGFIVAIAAALALTPIVWLHYFALLIVVVAVGRPRLGVIWFAPLGLVLTPGSGQPTPFETAWTLAVAGLTIGLAVRECRRRVRPALVRPVVAR
jgi:hypothetical protein